MVVVMVVVLELFLLVGCCCECTDAVVAAFTFAIYLQFIQLCDIDFGAVGVGLLCRMHIYNL